MELFLLKIVINHNPKIQHKKVKFSQRKWSRGLSFAWRPKIKTRYSWEATFKSNHAKGWCGPGWVRSSGDFDSLDSPGSWFLIPKVLLTSHRALKHRKKNQKKANDNMQLTHRQQVITTTHGDQVTYNILLICGT